MVPSSYVVLGALPLTPNGKVDRRALPRPAAAPARAIDFVAPRTAMEAALADLWCRVLGLDRVGVFDNFFELGGHSLKAMQVIAGLRRQYELELSLRDLLGSQTISRLAIVITQKRAEQMQEDEVLRLLQELDMAPLDTAPKEGEGQ